MAKRNLKDFLSDDTLDLSLNALQEVPVKDIAAYPKVTTLDLSNNKLISLSKSFAVSLTHLVKLDLARNELKELPHNFGLLVNLKFLDLYKNKLENLPLSVGNLKSLKWLDLKENPLEPHWQRIAGPCLDANDCKNAAKNVVHFASIMREQVEAELQRSQARQKQLEENEENEFRELAKKREKQREKKRRRNAAKLAEANQKNETVNGTVTAVETITPLDEEAPEPLTKSNFSLFECGRTVLLNLFIILLILTSFLFLLRFIHEPMYQNLMFELRKRTLPIISYVPGHWRVNLHEINLKILTSFKMFAFHAWSLLYKTSMNTYTFVTTDPKFEIYVSSILNFFFIFVC